MACFVVIYSYYIELFLLCKVTEAIWPRGNKTVFMLNLTEHEISTAHKT